MKNKLSTPQISTLMAEIRILKIGNKQMTISVFKQLYESSCYDEKYNILFPIWGKVKREDNEFVIFQKGSELNKMIIPKKQKVYSFEYSFYACFSDHYHTEYGHIINSIDEILNKSNQNDFFNGRYKEKYLFKDNEVKWFNSKMPNNQQEVHLYNFKNENDVIELLKLNLFSEAEISKIKNEYRIERSLVEAQHKMIDELNNAQQLFIAV